MRLIKYPGGKERELKFILPAIPNFNRYFEPFVGSGCVYLNINAKHYFINDKSFDLINLYQMVQSQDSSFYTQLSQLQALWLSLSTFGEREASNLIEAYNKARTHELASKNTSAANKELCKATMGTILKRLKALPEVSFLNSLPLGRRSFSTRLTRAVGLKIRSSLRLESRKGELKESDVVANLISAFKAGLYFHLRHEYNSADRTQLSNPSRAVLFSFLRDTCYSSMFRYNSKREFNVPYGGISYNNRCIDRRLSFYQSEKLQSKLAKTKIGNLDFMEFLQSFQPAADDFMFLDPPYDSSFSTYDQNSFSYADQERLAQFLIERCQCKFMLVIQDTPRIRELYPEHRSCANGEVLHIASFDYKYTVNLRNRNQRTSGHLMICNYPIPQYQQEKTAEEAQAPIKEQVSKKSAPADKPKAKAQSNAKLATKAKASKTAIAKVADSTTEVAAKPKPKAKAQSKAKLDTKAKASKTAATKAADSTTEVAAKAKTKAQSNAKLATKAKASKTAVAKVADSTTEVAAKPKPKAKAQSKAKLATKAKASKTAVAKAADSTTEVAAKPKAKPH